MRRGVLVSVMVAVVAISSSPVAFSLPASAATGGDWVSVSQVQVNKLGGINVAGQVSCQGTYQKLVAGQLQYQDEQGNPVTITLQSGDKVNLAANNDNYTVIQPAGRKTMVQVTHGSSRMNPCFLQVRANPDGTPMPDWVSCGSSGYPCNWQTDMYGYDHDVLGPLFDYSPNGMFKTGALSITEQSVGLFVMIAHFAGDSLTGWDTHFIPEGSYSVTSGTYNATRYRG